MADEDVAPQGALEPQPAALAGIRVLDFSQFLAGPMAALRLADLGADVIKVERPGGGDLCRSLMVADQKLGEDSLLFHTINRNKRSFAADLKDEGDLSTVWQLIETADVMIHNFRPGVMERIGLDHQSVARRNPRLVYAAVTGYGGAGPWRGKPGQDLLVQALSGMTWLSGNREDGPVPVGFSVLDITAGNHLTQGILAALVRRGVTGRGGLVEVSLLASALDLQFEQITAFANAASAQPQRSAVANASVHGAAPYGIFATKDGHLALAMMPIAKLADLIQAPALAPYLDPAVAFSQRDEIKAILSDHLATRTSREWLAVLEPADVWCAEVLDWPALMAHPGLAAIDPMQTIPSGGSAMTTTRCPIRMDGSAAPAGRGAPRLGEHTDAIRRELDR